MTPDSPNPTPPGDDRAARVERVVADVLTRRGRGEHVADEPVLAAHPDLQPALARALRTAAEVRRVTSAAARTVTVLARDELDAPLSAAELAMDDLPEPGPPAFDGYEVEMPLLGGSQGTVYVARQTSTGRRVAIKVLSGGRFAAPDARKRFEREAQILAKLDHPHLVSILDVGRTVDGSPFLVMPFVEGMTLDRHLTTPVTDGGLGGAGAGPVLELFERLARAMQAAHEANVVHRDLKPSNIRIDRNGEPRVLDFGLARLLEPAAAIPVAGDPSAAGLTVAQQLVGSYEWMSPEQAAGAAHSVDVRSDVYALGVLLYLAMTARSPYPEVEPPSVVLAHVLGTIPEAPSKVPAARPGVGRSIDAVVLKCLAKRPDDRYPTAAALANDLALCRAGRRPHARADRLARPVVWVGTQATGRDRWRLPAATTAAVVAVVAAVFQSYGLGLLGSGRPIVIPPGPVRPVVAPPQALSPIRMNPAHVPMGLLPVQGATFDANSRQGQAVVGPFYFSLMPVTRAQYTSIMGTAPGEQMSVPEQLQPATVTPAQFDEFCRRLSQTDNRRYRAATPFESRYLKQNLHLPPGRFHPYPAAVGQPVAATGPSTRPAGPAEGYMLIEELGPTTPARK